MQPHRQSSCSSMWPPRFLAVWRDIPRGESDCKQACGRCDQIDELLCLVAELQEEVNRQRSIQESEREIDQWSCTLPSMMHRSQHSVATMEAGPGSALCQEEGSVTRDREGWKKVTVWSSKRNPSLPSKLPSWLPWVQGPGFGRWST